MRAFIFVFMVLLHCAGAQAQERLTMGWTNLPPLFALTPDGKPGGFGVEVMTLIAQRAGFELDIIPFNSAEAMIAAQIAGDVDLTPGLLNTPNLAQTNLFSQPLSRIQLRSFVTAENSNRLDPAEMSGHRIGITGLAARLIDPGAVVGNDVSLVPVGHAGIVQLLTGQVDVLISGDAVTHLSAYQMRVDHRVVAVGQPLGHFDRVIALAKDRADLMDRIEAARSTLEADGTLQTLRERHQIELPAPPPATLVAGVYHFPPYNIVGDNGEFSGFSVETLRNLAQAAGIGLTFKEISREEWGQGPGPGRYDLIPQVGISASRRTQMDFTKPVDRSSFEIFTRAGESDGIDGLDTLVGKRVGVEAVNGARRLAQQHGGLQLQVFDGHAALLDALLDGQVDAILYPRHAVWQEAKRLEAENQIFEVAKPFHVIDRAIALRFGLGDIRERLNAVIPGYLASIRNDELRDKYFGAKVFWTPQRARVFAIAAGLFLALLTLGFALALWYRRGLEKRERQRYASDIIDKIPEGVVVVSPEGTIEFSNTLSVFGGAAAAFAPGRRHADVVREMFEEGVYFSTPEDREQRIETMLARDRTDGAVVEYALSNGTVAVRRSKRLANGAMLLVGQDITEDRRQSREIETLNEQLKEQIALAQASNEELRSFAYATSHDLKAPTNTSRMLIDLIAEELDGTLCDDQRDLLEDLRATNARMGQLIEDVLAYTDTIGADARREPVDLSQVLDAAVDDLRADIEAAQADIQSADLPTIEAHPSQMRQLMQNLIANAIKFRDASRQPVIRVTAAEAPQGSVAFSVSDNGIGIPAEHQPKIFRLFERLKTTSDVQGSGLGLSVCQRIVNNHRGRIHVQSSVGQGTCFTVILGGTGHDPAPHAG